MRCFSYAGCPEEHNRPLDRGRHLPLNLAIEARRPSVGSAFPRKLGEQGGIVEEVGLRKEGCGRLRYKCAITPLGDLRNDLDARPDLGGPSGQIFQACTFPADAGMRSDIQALAASRVGEVLKAKGVLGRFGVDFVSVPQDGGWRHRAIEINLRKGGTTHHVPDAAVP